MSISDVVRKDITAKDGSSVYVEVRRAKFNDVGKTGNEYTGLHEIHYKTTGGFEIKFHLSALVDERLLRDVARTECVIGRHDFVYESATTTAGVALVAEEYTDAISCCGRSQMIAGKEEDHVRKMS